MVEHTQVREEEDTPLSPLFKERVGEEDDEEKKFFLFPSLFLSNGPLIFQPSIVFFHSCTFSKKIKTVLPIILNLLLCVSLSVSRPGPSNDSLTISPTPEPQRAAFEVKGRRRRKPRGDNIMESSPLIRLYRRFLWITPLVVLLLGRLSSANYGKLPGLAGFRLMNAPVCRVLSFSLFCLSGV